MCMGIVLIDVSSYSCNESGVFGEGKDGKNGYG